MNALTQLRRPYSIGLGIFALALPFFVLSLDSTVAAPKSPPRAIGTGEPTASSEDDSPVDLPARRIKNVKVNYVSASWTKVLQDFAEATQTELVADRVPTKKFSRWDMKFYTRDEALLILNQELQPLNFRLQFKGRYLVLNALQEFRHEYQPAVIRGDYREQADEARAALPSAGGGDEAESRTSANAAREVARPKQISKSRAASRGAIQQVAGEAAAASAEQKPVATTVRLKTRDAVAVSKIIFKAFKPQAELVDDGPRGLQGFLVRQQASSSAGKKGAAVQAGDVRFSIGIDDKKNQLIVEATPDETKAVLKLIKALDVAPPSAQSTVRAISTTKDAEKLALALQPELNRLSNATQKAARRVAQKTGADGDASDDEPANEQPAAPRSGAKRDLRDRQAERDEPAERGQPTSPQALIGSLKGEVTVESVPDMGILIIKGNEKDVESVMSVIREIERLSVGTAPEVRVAFLRHVSSEALAELLTRVYEQLGKVRNATVQQSQAITVFPVARPNAVLIVASKADMPSVYELVDELDQASDPGSEFQVFRLKHAVPSQIVESVKELYPPLQGGAQQQNLVGLAPRVRIIDDLRTNSVIVQARPRDMREVARLIEQLDVVDTASEQRLKIFRLEYAVAEEVSATVSQAIQAVLNPSRATTVQQQPGQGGGQGGQGGGQGAGGQGSAELKEIKSAVLKFREKDGEAGRELRSGILADIRMTPDFRTNTIMVTAPEESMDLVAALIKELDRPPAAVAEIKIFRLKNSDATAMQALLSAMFGIQRTGQQGQAGGAGGAGAQPGVAGLLVADAEDTSSMLIPLRFSVDVRTNSITAIGGAAALNVVESILLTLDDSDIQQRKNEVYRLKNVPAATVAAAISQFLQTQRQVLTAEQGILSPFEQIEREVVVVAENVSNSLLISATPRYFDEVKKLIIQLDQSPKQVIIEALFVEVTLDNTDEFGAEFGVQDSALFKRSALTTAPQFITTTTNTPGVGSVQSQTVISQSNSPGFLFNGQQLGNNTSGTVNASNIAGQVGTGFATALSNSGLGFPGLLIQAGSQNLNLLLRALSVRNRIDILSRPLVRTVDNQTANIQVGQQVPIINGFTANATTGVNSPLVQQRQIGIILQVTPRITPDGLVVMEVVARKDSLAVQTVPLVTSPTGNVNSPIINTQNALTTIAVPTGQTVVLGGMITKNDTLTERKVPVLGDIPIVGNAFRYDLKQMTRTELIIFLTPRIIHSDEEAEMFKEIEMGRLNFIESEAERVHGPLHGLPSPQNPGYDPHYGFPAPGSQPATTPGKMRTRAPAPPEPGIPPVPREDLEDSTEDDARNGAALMQSDDEEDLEATFIQTNYRAPPKDGTEVGRANVGPSAKSAAAVKAKKGAARSKKTKPKPEES